MTIIEVVIAGGILGVALLGLFAMIGSTQTGAKFSNDVNIATSLANDKMEELKVIHYLYEKYTQYPDVTAYSDVISAAGKTYTRSWTVVPDQPLAGMTTIMLSVSWDGNKHKIALETGLASKINGTNALCP